MAVTLTPQDDTGTVVDANAYVDVAAFKTYCDNHGYDYSAKSDDQIKAAIIRATQYLDSRFQFRGVTLVATQTTMWPRRAATGTVLSFSDDTFVFDDPATTVLLVDLNGNDISGIPPAVKSATIEYSFRALTIALFQDAPAPVGGRWLHMESVEVDVIKRTVEYEPGQAGAFALPAFPAADMMLARAGLIVIGRTLYR